MSGRFADARNTSLFIPPCAFLTLEGEGMENYVNGKVIVITGAGSGFGKLTAEKASEMGGRIVCSDIHEENLKNVVEGIRKEGNEARYIVTDVAQKQQVDAMARFALDTYGRIDVLVNNAGTMPLAFYADHADAWQAWDKCIDVNLKGTLHGIGAVYDQMMSQGQGQIINVSSIYGNSPVTGAGVYQATKVAVRYLADVLRQEAQGTIKVSVISPSGVVSTGLMGTVVNPKAGIGIYGQNFEKGVERATKLSQGEELPPGYFDVNSVQYWRLHPEAIVENIIYCINQPWGISIGDITVRSTGELYVL